ncbi:MAG: DUF6049 family protein [Actinobacteria bacterium]|nr:DUF6049 family protein [Actinomycetota bacterium]
MAEPINPLEAKVVLDKATYKKGDVVNVSIILTKTTTGSTPPLRVYIALKDKTGKTIAYRNRYIGRFVGNNSVVQASFNTRNLNISGITYPVEVQIFARGKQLLSSKAVVIFAQNPKPLEVVYFLNIRMPYRLSDENLLDGEGPLDYLTQNQNIASIISLAKSQKTPLLIAISTSSLLQLKDLSDGFKLKTEEGIKDFKPDSPQSTMAKQLYKEIESLLSSGESNICVYPYGDVNPITLSQYGLASESIDRIEKSRQELERLKIQESFRGFVYLPNGGIDRQTVNELSRSGYSIVVDKTSDKQVSGVFENAIVLFAEKPNSDKKPVDFVFQMLDEHFKKDKTNVLIFDVSNLDYKYISELTNELKRYPFVKIKSSPPFSLIPLNTIEETKPIYNEFKSLIPSLFKNYKEAKSMLQAFEKSFVVDEKKKKELRYRLESAFLFALNPPNEFDTAFRNLKILKQTIKDEFSNVTVFPSKISFTSTKGQLPVSVINKTGYPAKVILTLSADGAVFSKPKKIVVINSNENVFTFPITLERSGKIRVKVLVESLDGYPISKGYITINSNYRAILLSASLFILLILAGLIWLRKKIKSRINV